MNKNHNIFKKGDIITSYDTGYHKVILVQKRWKNANNISDIIVSEEPTKYHTLRDTDVITYQKVYNIKGKPTYNELTNSCKSSLCKLAKIELNRQISELENTLTNLKELKKNIKS